jgi:hypothetical protein
MRAPRPGLMPIKAHGASRANIGVTFATVAHGIREVL